MNSYETAVDGIFYPKTPIVHREDEYSEAGFETLLEMQDRHFWYRGRHRFLLKAVDRFVKGDSTERSAIDLGGGVGGWLRDLARERARKFKRLALADSSRVALKKAESVLPPSTERYQIDLMNLQMEDCWDAAFLLDVIEHLPNDLGAIIEAKNSLKKDGLLFITTPAFPAFWSYNDDLAHHLRRYVKSDFKRLATESGMQLVDCRYFMFFLSPLYLVSRLKPGIKSMSFEEKKQIVENQHKIPPTIINNVLATAFVSETPVGHWVPFPWGTSVMAVLRRSHSG
jgi:SAM-dependent methyltransferase